MQDKSSKENIISSLFWKLLERSGTQGVQFIIQIVIARVLEPEQFGIIAIVMVFINLAQVFVQNGFSVALIQKKNADNLDFSTVLYLSLGLSIIMYGLIYASAPYIASYYKDDTISLLLRVLAITLFPGAFNSVQNAYVSRHFMFDKLFMSSIGSTVISGVIGISAAIMGYGAWALVIQQITNQLTVSIIMYIVVPWRPVFQLSIHRAKVLFSFGWKILLSSFLNVLYLDMRTLIIGGMYNSSLLAYYNRGEQFPKLITTNIDGSIQSVMLPALSLKQDDKQSVKSLMRKSIITSSFFIFPMMVGLAVVAEPLIRITLTDKWLPSVLFLQIFCFSYALTPIHTANLQAINAVGRSDIFLKLEIIKKILGLVILVASIPFGINAIAGGQVVHGIIATFINSFPNSRLLNYSYKEQWNDIVPSLLGSLSMGISVHILSFFISNPYFLISLQIFIGVAFYLGISRFVNRETFTYVINTSKIFFQKIKLP